MSIKHFPKTNKLYTFLLSICAMLCLCSAKHYGPKYDVAARNALDRFAVQFAQKHDLKFLNSGLGLMAGSKESDFCLSLTSDQSITLEQSQTVVKDLSFQLLHLMYHNKLYANYYKKANSNFTDNLMSFRLAFWNENMDRPLYPYLAQICLRDSHIYYYYADPVTQALQEPIVLSLQELNLSNYK